MTRFDKAHREKFVELERRVVFSEGLVAVPRTAQREGRCRKRENREIRNESSSGMSSGEVGTLRESAG